MFIKDLKPDEMKRITGGGFWVGVWAAAAFHVAKEAYNDWDSHARAFSAGRSSVN